jgi:hypothetical protein
VVSQLVARSVSRPVWERLRETSPAGQVVAVLRRSCVLRMGDGDLAILVLTDIGDGPLNVVMEGEPGAFAAVEAGSPAWLEAGRLLIGRLEVVLDSPAVWEPRPDWHRLRSCREAVKTRLCLLRALALRQAAEGSLLVPFFEADVRRDSHGTSIEALVATALEAAESLREGWLGNPIPLQRGASRLAGLGGGLTPAGDDFLCGVMLWAWLVHPSPPSFCQPLLETAAGRTTALSAAFLRAAARGECSAAWHRLLAALARWRLERPAADASEPLERSVREVLSFGSTSGGDTLAGFLWVGCPPDCQ